MKYRIVSDSSSNLYSLPGSVDYTTVPLKIRVDDIEYVDEEGIDIADLTAHMKTTKKPSTLTIDGQPITTDTPTAGLGYVKQRLNGIEPRTFTAEKTSDGTSWGALYAQFWQKSSDVKASANGMTVKRELLTSDGNPLSGELKVGDKVRVRITIVADRDYDFVQVQDKRAACMEPVRQLSGYVWQKGCYCAPKDNVTNYYFDLLSKGRHTIETEYYVDREGTYETGSCTAQCAYSPEFRGTTKSITINVQPRQ